MRSNKFNLKSTRKNNQFYTKSIIEREGTLYMKCSVVSNRFKSIETAQSTILNIKQGISFPIEKNAMQCVYGHLSKKGGDSHPNVYCIDFSIGYKDYNGMFKFKQISVKNKRYLQEFKGNKFHKRYKTKYLTKQRINKILKHLGYQ